MKLGTKRRKTKAQMQADREEEEMKAEAEQHKTDRIRELERQVAGMQSDYKKGQASQEVLGGLMSKGKIEMNAPGKFSIAGDQSEDNYVEINPEDLGMD